jgi:sulfate-transporting ATPase
MQSDPKKLVEKHASLTHTGLMKVISHDRWFLDRIATHMLAFEGDSNVVWFEGNYEDYKADQPRRIKYKKLAG